jgi:hypothetical protein
MTVLTGFDRMKEELEWLQANPDFDERPATIAEFVTANYLNCEEFIRPPILVTLKEIFGEDVSQDSMSAYSLAMITGGIGIGKGGRASDRVVTPLGWKRYDELELGDNVIGSDGTATDVTGIYPRGELDVFRVNFTDGSSVVVDADHLWEVQVRRKGEWVSRTMDTRTLMDSKMANNDGTYRYRIPMVKPVQYADWVDLPVDPYTLGIILGDGSITNGSVRISGDDLEVGTYIQEAYPTLQMTRCQDGRQWTLGHGKGNFDHAVRDGLVKLGLSGLNSHEKFVPEEYLRAPVEDRLNLLRGLMDSDGGALGINKIRFTSRNMQLCLDVQEIVQSVGGTAQIFTHERGDGRGTDYYVNVCCPFNPFRLPRKAAMWKPRTNQPIRRAITSIEPAGQDEVICIKVAASDSLYVTENYIVTHNTTIASIVLPYLAHWTLCLRDPQRFFNLLPGSRIAFMQMSTSGKQAKEVVFGDIKARIKHAPWFKKYPYDTKFKNQLRFDKEIWILPGDSGETTFEGYNILGGILDEADSHQVTDKKDYAEQGYTTINSRIESRFGQVERNGKVRPYGFLLVIGQMKKGNGFAARKYKEFKENPNAYAYRMAIWESFGWQRYLKDDGSRDSFWYHTGRHEIIPTGVAGLIKDADRDKMIEVPEAFRQSFENAPEKALRDLAGIPPLTGSPFISLSYKVTECRERWLRRYNPVTEQLAPEIESPVDVDNKFAEWFHSPDSLPRVAHIDLAYSANGDGCGLAMGHCPEVREVDGEMKPVIVFDFLMQIRAPAGREIFIGDIRRIIYSLKDDKRFKIRLVTTDGFQSTDTRQQLERRRIGTEMVSMDKSLAPYEDLREAIYEDRLEFPKYMVRLRQEDTELTEIAVKELMELVDTGKKVDHPDGGSKDVADAMAGVTYSLMGDRSYHRKRRRMVIDDGTSSPTSSTDRYGSLGVPDLGSLHVPLPPTGDAATGPLWHP